MALEPVSRIINKANHWPIAKRREYLILALECEKNRHRRRLITVALRDITTRVIRQELRHERN